MKKYPEPVSSLEIFREIYGNSYIMEREKTVIIRKLKYRVSRKIDENNLNFKISPANTNEYCLKVLDS